MPECRKCKGTGSVAAGMNCDRCDGWGREEYSPGLDSATWGKVLEFPSQATPEFIFGPFTENRVVIDGRNIPKLSGRKIGDDQVELVVDGRFSATFKTESAYQAAWLIANAMAIGAGYPSMNADSKDQPFAPKVFMLGDGT